MSGKSPIQWTEATWNPVVGCTHVSAGCDHCYARTLHDQRRYIPWKRGNFPGAPVQYHQPFKRVQLMPDRLDAPLHWRKPRRVFVNSVGDLFHEDVPDEFILQVFSVMAATQQHTFQILTKRPQRMRDWCYHNRGWLHHGLRPGWDGSFYMPLSNVWLGVSVENQAAADERIPLLLETPAAVRFLSCEPLLGPLNLREYIQLTETNAWDYGDERAWDYEPYSGGFANENQRPNTYNPQPGIHWVIIGGESGPHARPMELAWVESLLAQCWAAQVPAFVKQLGAVWAHKNRAHGVRDNHGGVMADWPAHLRIREYPQTGGDAA